jgi:hypothetical protein
VTVLKNVYATIDEIAPGFSDGIIDQQVLLPPDISASSTRRMAISSTGASA